MPSGGADDAGPGSNELQDTEESSLHLEHVRVIARILGKDITGGKIGVLGKHHHHLCRIFASSLAHWTATVFSESWDREWVQISSLK